MAQIWYKFGSDNLLLFDNSHASSLCLSLYFFMSSKAVRPVKNNVFFIMNYQNTELKKSSILRTFMNPHRGILMFPCFLFEEDTKFQYNVFFRFFITTYLSCFEYKKTQHYWTSKIQIHTLSLKLNDCDIFLKKFCHAVTLAGKLLRCFTMQGAKSSA